MLPLLGGGGERIELKKHQEINSSGTKVFSRLCQRRKYHGCLSDNTTCRNSIVCCISRNQDAPTHKKKANFEELLESGGLGEDRLVKELEKGLNAKFAKYYQDEFLCELDDNTVQQRARELLADLLGQRKQKVDVEHSGMVGASVVLYIPDNGRGDKREDD